MKSLDAVKTIQTIPTIYELDIFLKDPKKFKRAPFEIQTNVQSNIVQEWHKDSQGFIASCYKRGDEWNQHSFKVKSFELEKNNGYFSLNTFSKPYRRKEYLYEYIGLYSDLDYYTYGLNKEAVIWHLENDVFGKLIPWPTYLIDSGNGLYYMLKFTKSVPARRKKEDCKEGEDNFNSKVFRLWTHCMKYIYSVLKEYGADVNALDVCRVFRGDGTTNTKCEPKDVQMIYNYGNTVTLNEFKEEWLPDPEWTKQNDSNNKLGVKPTAIINGSELYNNIESNKDGEKHKKGGKSLKSLNSARALDLFRLLRLRKYDVTGQREYFLFLYSYFSLLANDGDTDKTFKSAMKMNSCFTQQIEEGENQINAIVKCCYRAYQAWATKEEVMYNSKRCRKGYNYKNTSIIELFKITIEEQKRLKTIKIKMTKEEYNDKRKTKRRNKDGLTSRAVKKQDTIQKILTFKEQGHSNSEIARQLGISRQIVSQYVNQKM